MTLPVAESYRHLRDLFDQWKLDHLERHAQEYAALMLHRADMDRRLAEMNNLRAQIEAERGNYPSRSEHNQLLERVNKLEIGSGANRTGVWILVGIIGSVVALIAIGLDAFVMLRR